MRVCKAMLFALGCVILAPAMASAQGSIAGIVKDSSGAVLPGVTVEAASPALIEKVRSVITDGTGQYKIVDLRPGVYTVTFTLQGFSAVKREGIELVGSFAAAVNAELKVGSVTETVVVTGESPIVDIQSVAKQQVLTKDVIDALPAGRNHFDQAVLIPGLQASQPGRGALMDVGGTNNLQNTTATMHGNRSTDTRVLVDGISIRNIGSEGQFSNFVPDTGSTQETTFDYGAISSEQAFGGLRINLVPREGGNRFNASAFGTGANSSFQGNNYTDDLKSRGLSAPNSLNQMYDLNFSGGGPIVKDRLWFFSSTRFQANKNNVAGVFENLNAGKADAWTYVPDTTKQGVFSMTQKSINTRLTAQVTPRNKVSVFFENQGRVWFDERATVSPEAATTRLFPQEWLGAIGWTSPLTSRLLLDAHFGNHAEVYYQPVPYPGDPYGSIIPVMEQSSGLLYRAPGLADPCCFTGSSMPHIYNSSASLSYVTGAHALKVGFSNISGRITNSSYWNSTGLSYRFNNGVPNQITERGTPFQTIADLDAELGVFAQDKWTLKRTTVNAGVRFDAMRTSFPEQQLGPAPLVPNRNVLLDAVSRQNLKDISPRLGVVYDLFGDGKTAVKVMLGKYVLATNPGTGNPIGNLSTNVTRNWTDANGNYVVDCDLLNAQQQDLRSSGRDFCGTISDTRFGSVLPSTAIDPLTYTGWGNRAYNYEFTTGVQREIAPRVSMDFGYFRRWYGNFQTTDNRAITGADFDPYSIVSPVNPALPNGGGYTVSGLYNLNPSKVGLVDNYVTFTDNFGQQIEHWNGVDLSVNARLNRGILLQGGFSTGRTSTDNCAVATSLDNPSPLYCHVDTAFLTQVKFLGTYTVPKVDVRIAATFQTYPGPVVAANYVATNAEVQPTLGRPLSGGATNVTVNIVAPGTMYGERASQLDVRFSKLLRFGKTRTGVNFDLANILNANPALTQNNNYASWQVPTGIMDARLAKFSVQFDF